jgi:hypothetical protein
MAMVEFRSKTRPPTVKVTQQSTTSHREATKSGAIVALVIFCNAEFTLMRMVENCTTQQVHMALTADKAQRTHHHNNNCH